MLPVRDGNVYLTMGIHEALLFPKAPYIFPSDEKSRSLNIFGSSPKNVGRFKVFDAAPF